MERINIIIDDPAARFGPRDVYLTGLSRVQQDDGEIEVNGYGFTSDRWSWTRVPWWAWWNRAHGASWGYIYEFSDSQKGVSRVCDVVPALAAVGARFDPAGPPDPPPPVVSDPILDRLLDEEDSFARLLREAYERFQRPVADAYPVIRAPSHGGITYNTSGTFRFIPIPEEEWLEP